MTAFYNSPEYESEKLIDEMEHLKRTNIATEKRIQVIEKRLLEIKNNDMYVASL